MRQVYCQYTYRKPNPRTHCIICFCNDLKNSSYNSFRSEVRANKRLKQLIENSLSAILSLSRLWGSSHGDTRTLSLRICSPHDAPKLLAPRIAKFNSFFGVTGQRLIYYGFNCRNLLSKLNKTLPQNSGMHSVQDKEGKWTKLNASGYED